jgi:hypothetical protein
MATKKKIRDAVQIPSIIGTEQIEIDDGSSTYYKTTPNQLLTNVFIYKGTISTSSDFPTLVAVHVGWLYRITTAVTDNDVSKTNTGQSFIANDEIYWNGSNWNVITESENLWNRTGTVLSPNTPNDSVDIGSGAFTGASMTGNIVTDSLTEKTLGNGVVIPTGIFAKYQTEPTFTTGSTQLATIKYVDDHSGGGGEKDYDATVGTGGDYATIQLAIDANKYKILILDGYTETAPIVIPNQGAYYFYAKKTVDLSTYSIRLYPSTSSTNAIYFSGSWTSIGRLFSVIPGMTTSAAVHILPATSLNQSAAVKDTSGFIAPSDPSLVFLNIIFYPGTTYLLPENDTTAIVNAGGSTLFNNSTITFPGGSKNFGDYSISNHTVSIIGGLNSTGNLASISTLKTLFTVLRLDGFLDFSQTSVQNGSVFTVKLNGAYRQFGQIMGCITPIPINANTVGTANQSLSLDEVAIITDKSQVGDDYPKTIWITHSKNDSQIASLVGHNLILSGSGNSIASFRVPANIPAGAIIDKTSPKSNQAPYGAGGVSILNPGSGIPGSIAFAALGGSGSGAWFSANVSGGSITSFVFFGNPTFNGSFRYGSYITGSGYVVGDILNDSTYGIQLQVLNVHDGNSLTISGNENFVRVVGPCGGIKITGNNNIVYVPYNWSGTRTDTGTGNKIIVGTKDLTVYNTTVTTPPNVFVDTDGSLKRTTSAQTADHAFLAELGTSQPNVTGDSTWVTYIFDVQREDVGNVYNPSTGQFGAPFKCLAQFGANITMTNAVGFPGASDYSLKFVRRDNVGTQIEEVVCVIRSCSTAISGASPQLLTDNVSASFTLNQGDTVELQGRVSTIGIKTVSFYASSSNQCFWGNIVAAL